MPWKTRSLLEARQGLVQAALRGLKSVAQLCRDFGVRQKTGFKWRTRFRTLGGPGLRDRSRRPRRSPHRPPARWLTALRQVRRQPPHWGAKKISARLRQKPPRARRPKVRTITDWLRRLGLARHPRGWTRRGPQLPRPALTVPRAPNEVWPVAFKGGFRTRDGQRVAPLTVRDLCSRCLLGIRLLRHRHEPVRQCFQGLFARDGKPKIIRADHGAPFAGEGALDLSRLSAWWLRRGIQVEFTRRARPQDNAAHEQMHRVCQAEVASPPAATPRGQPWRTTRWIRCSNQERPHEALGQRVPAAGYRKSRRRYRAGLPELEYPRGWLTRRGTASGCLRWRGRVRVMGRAFGGQRVGFKPVSAGVQEVSFGRHLIGQWVATDPGGLRPAQWAKALPTKPKP